MWTCPKCGREFKRTNQSHYCGKAPESVDEYIELQITDSRSESVCCGIKKSNSSLCSSS